MTTHSDRDRSEAPWWPPAAPAAYAGEPVPFVLTDEPQGELVRRFPLDDGDPGTSLLPVAPEGIELQCSMCPATLADTGGGVLWHNRDGSHTFEPSGAPAGNPLHGLPANRGADGTIPGAMLRELAARLERELADERAKVARVEALLAEWDAAPNPAPSLRATREVLHAALAGPEPEATTP